MEIKKNWELSPAHFGPLWKYVEDDEITDIDLSFVLQGLFLEVP